MTTGTRERGYRYIAATHRPVCGARAAGRLAQRSGHRGCDGQQGPTCLERYAIANARVNVNSRRYRIFRLEPRKPPRHLFRSERTSGSRGGEARPPALTPRRPPSPAIRPQASHSPSPGAGARIGCRRAPGRGGSRRPRGPHSCRGCSPGISRCRQRGAAEGPCGEDHAAGSASCPGTHCRAEEQAGSAARPQSPSWRPLPAAAPGPRPRGQPPAAPGRRHRRRRRSSRMGPQSSG